MSCHTLIPKGLFGSFNWKSEINDTMMHLFDLIDGKLKQWLSVYWKLVVYRCTKSEFVKELQGLATTHWIIPTGFPDILSCWEYLHWFALQSECLLHLRLNVHLRDCVQKLITRYHSAAFTSVDVSQRAGILLFSFCAAAQWWKKRVRCVCGQRQQRRKGHAACLGYLADSLCQSRGPLSLPPPLARIRVAWGRTTCRKCVESLQRKLRSGYIEVIFIITFYFIFYLF